MRPRLDLVIAFVSLALSVYAIERVERIGAVVIQSADTTKRISENLTTRYIGEFPSFIPEINKVLNDGKESISIASNLPGYAMYSDHAAFLDYVSAINHRVSSGVRVKLIILSDPQQARFRERQFAKDTIEDLKDPKSSANLNFRRFLIWSGRKPEDITTMAAFRNALAVEQKNVLEHQLGGVECLTYDKPMTLFLWIADEHEAVFAVPTFPVGHEGAFLTHDQRLITELLSAFDGYSSESSSCPGKPM